MKRIAILLVSLLRWTIIYASVAQPTAVPLNKTKRTLADTATYGEKPAPLFYAIPDGTRPDFFATTKTFALAKPPLSAVFDPEVPKQVAAQQVLYEYQQTPTNAVSNVHVKQLFQPLETGDGNNTPQFNQNNNQNQPHHQQNHQNTHTSETVVNPVQHSSLVNHGQNYAHVQFQPYYPQHTQTLTQHYVPGRYFYVNGKYVYPPLPSQPHYPAQSQNQIQNVNAPQQVNKPVSYITYGTANNLLKQRLTPPPTGAPMNYNKFVPPQKQDIQPITKPVQSTPKVREEVDEEEENASVQKEDERNDERNEESNEDDNDEKSNYDEESEENDDHYGKYFDDEEEDRGRYREEEEEEDDDSERKASKVVKVHRSPSKNKKNSPTKKRHNDKNNYAWSESYSHSSKYENGKKKSDKSKESKKYDTTKKKAAKKNRNKPKKGGDRIEGRYSHNIPVIHEHNIFREKWYLSKSKNDRKS